jgi:nucleotide-binding universal stress UspA family protein
MNRVLLPVDGSDCSLRAVDYLIDECTDDEPPDVHLLNVQPPLTGDVSQFFRPEDVLGYHHDESQKALLGARERLDAAGVPYVAHEEVGPVAATIAGLADRLRCDHIVMGTHGRGALKKLLVGSTTMKVVHLARMPIILVK